MPLSEALEPLRAEVVGAARQAALESRIDALVERLLDLCLLDVASLTAGGSVERRESLRRAFICDLARALEEVDRCSSELVDEQPGSGEAIDRSVRARRLALAARLERRAARAAAKLDALRDAETTLSDAPA